MPADEAIVLVGGLGTRLRSVVSDVPKPLAPVAGRPFLAFVLDALARNGMRRVVLATGYRGELVEAAIGARWDGMEIVYSREPEPLGTGGAIKLAARQMQGDGVHVLNGDTFLRYDARALEALARKHDVDIGMALASVDDVARYGAVQLAGDVVERFEEKGRHGAGFINAGCYFVGKRAIDALPEGAFSFETHALAPAATARGVVGLRESSGFIDIGVPEDYARAQTLFGPAAA